MLFTIMAALAQMEHDIKRERIVDSISNVAAPGRILEGAPAVSPTAKFAALCAWLKVGSQRRRLPAIWVCPARRSIEGRELSLTRHSTQPRS